MRYSDRHRAKHGERNGDREDARASQHVDNIVLA